MVFSPDDRVAVAANRSANSISVFNVSESAAVTRSAELSLPPSSEPWAAVVSSSEDAAFVILRGTQRVVRINALHAAPTIAAMTGRTGSEPTAIAISPNGTKLYVANWIDGTVSVLSTADLSTVATVDLNAALASSGMLGTVSARPALAHPRALIVTDNGDRNDEDETVYVTEFFGQRRTSGVPSDGTTEYDQDHQGVLYRFDAATRTVGSLITIAPVADTGFNASNDLPTGCWPNQLGNLAINGERLYVSAVCTSPRGPVNVVVPSAPADGGVAPAPDVRNVKTEVHAAVFVVDTRTNTEIPAQGALLTQKFQALYDGPMPSMPTVPDDGSRRVPLLPSGMAFVRGTSVLYVSAYGSDAVFRVRYGADGAVAEVGSTANRFINLAAGSEVGRLPIGITVGNTAALANTALVLNEHTRNVSVINLTTQSVTSVVASAPMPAAGSHEERVNDGRRFFVTGTGRWSLRGQSWNSCESCHVDGLSDNVTWFFARGPRQSTSLDGSYGPDGSQRIFNWTAIFDETQDLEANTRANSGGVGGVVHQVSMPAGNGDRVIFDGTTATGTQLATATPQGGLSGSAVEMLSGNVERAGMPGVRVPSAVDDWNRIREYVLQIRAPHAPSNLAAADVTAGRALFESNNCGGCHGGSLWTVSRRFYTPSEANNNPTTGLLRMRDFVLPMGFPSPLAPLAAMGPARLRYNGSDSANFDSIQCVLRAVGTFPATLDADRRGISAADVHVREVRGNMSTAAQGAEGFNVPALIGMSAGAPYLHAGNARTLEELFSAVFDRHTQALSANFLLSGDRATQVRQLVAFIQSIDDSTAPVPLRGGLTFDPDLCPVSFP